MVIFMQTLLAPNNLAQWLSDIERFHPKSIAMGLERVNCMIERLALKPRFNIITVAGTNGKGSTCAMLERIYMNAGYRVACYTSPHLLKYNERVRVNGLQVNDDALCAAFSAVNSARGDNQNEMISLTYFEMGTLAAIWHFMQSEIDVAILEVGLGGRLDAVNAFEPNCAIVTSVDLDHQEFLGDTREAIGLEKAGVYRRSVTAICGDSHPPLSLTAYACEIGSHYQGIHQDFDFKKINENTWHYLRAGDVVYELPLPIMLGRYQLSNASCAISAVQSLQAALPVQAIAIATAMRQVSLAGRFQRIHQSPDVILDVAHNPHAARGLAENLKLINTQGKTIAVFAMLADKDIAGVISALKGHIDVWFVASIAHPRGALAENLQHFIRLEAPNAPIKTFAEVRDAYHHAYIEAGENDKIIVFGSFFTVSDVMQGHEKLV